ncbi:MAG TPA: [Fe-Fe] hydrogenase large subunit C-terminal domain-containing protein, partial [Ignavibacteriales bacterium]|nr:[Fe-Fe] hydrogenase large subunit C-terminal domain-containing protein [Ignavibacteriales bacterium]
DALNPIYTEKADCQDCYKCLRVCPVKSIRVENGSAAVIYENCILCGSCYEVCPSQAKKVRNDVDKVKELLKRKKMVIASLAPSYVNEFSNIPAPNLIRAFKSLGFTGVSETAIGAREVSRNTADMLSKSSGGLYFSTACPAAVNLITKYYPEYADRLTPFHTPLGAHAITLKKEYGYDVGVVFFGPCIAKKKEADDNPSLIDAALTFADLKRWMEEENTPLNREEETDDFLLGKASYSAMYPVEGGMTSDIANSFPSASTEFMTVSGVKNIMECLKGLNDFSSDKNIFVELLACEGGCVNGPLADKSLGTVRKRIRVVKEAQERSSRVENIPIDIKLDYLPAGVAHKERTEEEITAVLNSIGKHSKKDELNCGGCGYDACLKFAEAMLEGKAEKIMCVTYMRQLAQKKANALMRTMPSGVVIVDADLKIIECNYNFARLFGEDIERIYNAKPGMEGALLRKVIPFSKIFQTALETGADIVGKEIHYKNSVLLFSIFTIEKGRVIGGLFRDITEPAVRKEQIINKAQDVIRKNLSTVQKIAYLLGENAAESEIILNSIINSFSTDKLKDIEDQDENGTTY